LELDGKDVRIAGFVAPLRFDGSKISEFLLVPYVGACIHVPAPPSNQIVIVSGFEGFRPSGDLMYPVQVTGKLHVPVIKTDLGDVAYQIKGAKVERYWKRGAGVECRTSIGIGRVVDRLEQLGTRLETGFDLGRAPPACHWSLRSEGNRRLDGRACRFRDSRCGYGRGDALNANDGVGARLAAMKRR
jgi:hypothetical protein